MPTLKYWDGAAWQYLVGSPPPPSYRQTVYTAVDDSTINVNATSYGYFLGPSVSVVIGSSGAALIHFYAQIGLSSGADLIVTFSVVGPTNIAASDSNCLYVAPDGPVGGTNAWEQGPGHISGIMVATGMTPGAAHTFYAHYRVSTSTTSVLRRRLAVIPTVLSI